MEATTAPRRKAKPSPKPKAPAKKKSSKRNKAAKAALVKAEAAVRSAPTTRVREDTIATPYGPATSARRAKRPSEMSREERDDIPLWPEGREIQLQTLVRLSTDPDEMSTYRHSTEGEQFLVPCTVDGCWYRIPLLRAFVSRRP